MIYIVSAVTALAGAALVWVFWRMHRRNAFIWLPAYIKGDWAGSREEPAPGGPVHVLFCVADHFEPGWNHADPALQIERVDEWVKEYPSLADEFRDADGVRPQHTFFFPAEQYRPELIDRLRQLVAYGYGEVEVHLHHDGDTSEGTSRKLQEFTEQLERHGLLGVDFWSGNRRFGFIHGNWALDNSLPGGEWCGVNDQLKVLRRRGCYADFTLPSAPSAAQTRRINSIYYAKDDPHSPKSHDDGREVQSQGSTEGDLMLIQGPLGMVWPGGKFGILPRLINGAVPGGGQLNPRRVDTWINTRVCVAGRPEWVFVKLHTHGCNPRNSRSLLGRPWEMVHRYLGKAYNDGKNYKLHYVTAREMFNIVKAAEKGLTGDPGQYRDYRILPPPAARAEEEKSKTKEAVIER